MDFEFEQCYIETKKAHFNILFNKDADENLELFLNYILEKTNRELKNEIELLNKEISERDLKGNLS